jgi:hypothetical protein
MLHRAVAEALSGKNVMVVAATHEHAVQMFQRVADMQTPQKASRSSLTLNYGRGGMRFIAGTRDRDNERGFGGLTFVDHYAHERFVELVADSRPAATPEEK